MSSIAKMRLEKTSNTMTPPPKNKKVKVNLFCENIRKRKNAVDTCADKVVEDAKNKKRLSLNHTTKEVQLAHSFKL